MIEIRRPMEDWKEVTDADARLFVLTFCTRWVKDLDTLEYMLCGRLLRGCTVHELFEGHENQLPQRIRGAKAPVQSDLEAFS